MKRYILFFCLSTLICLNGCFQDDTTLATDASRVGEINVQGLKDTSMIAYAQPLELTAEVAGFADDELTYAWYIYGGQYSKNSEGYRSHPIGEGKKLSYPVELKIGSYTVVCEVTHKASGYFTTATFNLNVTSDFSQGFYVLKETADGNTELDFYNHLKKTTNNDLLAKVLEAPLAGEPRNLSTVFQKTHLDPATATSTHATGLFVAHGDNGCVLFNTTDMSVTFDRTNLQYGEMEADEMPYAMVTFNGSNYYLSNKGVATDRCYDDWTSEYATGQLSLPTEAGASGLIQSYNLYGISYWSQNEHCLMRTTTEYGVFAGCFKIDYEEDYTGLRIDWEKAIPVTSGWNYIDSENTIWYMFDVPGEGRYMVIIKSVYGKKVKIEEVRLMDPALHIAKAEIIAGRGKENNVIYCIDDNRLYRYSVTEGSETSLTFDELPGGNITYLSNLFYGEEFDFIVVGVQNGDKYTMAMYGIAGGQPAGTPVHTFTGTGEVKKVCYVIPYNGTGINSSPFTRYPDPPTIPY